MNNVTLVDIAFSRVVNGEVEYLTVHACRMIARDSDLFPGEIDVSRIPSDSFKTVEALVGGGFKACRVRKSHGPDPHIREFVEWMKSDAYNLQVD